MCQGPIEVLPPIYLYKYGDPPTHTCPGLWILTHPHMIDGNIKQWWPDLQTMYIQIFIRY